MPVLVGCSALGLYTTMVTLVNNGLGAVLTAAASGAATALAGAPEPLRRTYTGVAAVDRQLTVLVGFFSAAVDGGGAVPPECTLYYAWAMAQFAAGWTVLLLESRRAGSLGRAPLGGAVWLLLAGLLIQNVGYTVAVPLWLAAHLLRSPVARLRSPSVAPDEGADPSAVGPGALFVPLWELALLPASVTLTFIAPAVLMSMPSLLGHSAATHYGLLAVWQAFPLWNLLVLWASSQVCPRVFGTLGRRHFVLDSKPWPLRYKAWAARVYGFALGVAVAAQLPVLAVALAPSALRAAAAAAAADHGLLSFLRPYLAPRVSLASIFLPPSPLNPPTVDPATYAAGELAPLAIYFLQYDVYIGGASLLLWALYLHQTGARNPSVVGALKKVGFWFLLGGPHAAVVALLKDRDAALLSEYDEDEEESPKKTN